jgi:DnaJ family protein C protein 7
MGDLENAIKHFQQIMRCDPDNSTVRDEYKRCKEIEEKKEAGNAAFKSSSLQQAIDLWTVAIDLDRENAAVTAKLYCNRATALSKLKQHEEAISDATEAIRLDKEYAKAYMVCTACLNAYVYMYRLNQNGLSCLSKYKNHAWLLVCL